MENPDDHIVLPEIVSKEPLGPLVRHGDDQWADVGRWVLNALVIACLLYTSPSPRDGLLSRMPSSA